jgi:hypothetical protein
MNIVKKINIILIEYSLTKLQIKSKNNLKLNILYKFKLFLLSLLFYLHVSFLISGNCISLFVLASTSSIKFTVNSNFSHKHTTWLF